MTDNLFDNLFEILGKFNSLKPNEYPPKEDMDFLLKAGLIETDNNIYYYRAFRCWSFTEIIRHIKHLNNKPLSKELLEHLCLHLSK